MELANKIFQGDSLEVLKTFPDECVDCVITSPPYYSLRDYNVAGQIGLETTPEEYVAKLVAVFHEAKRVLKKEGTLFLNLGDSYASNGKSNGDIDVDIGMDVWRGRGRLNKHPIIKPKDLIGIPWAVAFALRADGWYLRQDIIWAKPNPMPESVQGSHFYRHRVTIDKYEELQRVWETKSINKDGASDLSNLSSGKVSDSETALHEKSERDSNSKSERTATRSKREAKPILGNDSGEIESREISGDSKGNGEHTEAISELPGTTSESGRSSNITGLDGHSGPPSLSLFLLQPEKFQNDSRPQNPVEQRREKLAREHSASLPQVQLHKEGQNRVEAEEIDCPGCYMCENQNGFIFTLSAGRCTKSHEYIFLLSKSPKYYFDNEAIKEVATGYDGRKDTLMKGSKKYADGDYLAGGNANSLAVKGRERWKYKNLQEDGQTTHTMHEKRLVGEEYLSPVRNKRSVWTVNTKPFKEAHFATFPEKLIEPMVKAGCPENGIVLDPFFGAGTTGVVAKKLGRDYVGIELNPDYIKIAENRLRGTPENLFKGLSVANLDKKV